ncbi:AraC-like DNA-binding protein [Amycolatopsis echigonensis]|uniref:AraC-like DNA-binding protein n=1 Tax=Amycolatopsis echigonensis TaxID=2576905 RepID=A0A2N3WNK3_9PSEU|nr:AraC-like DNA-binding protein [Amycolatopsis niigatensis]
MVKTGQPDASVAVAEFSFGNPDRALLDVEVVDLGRLTGRISPETRTVVHRTDFHQIFLVTRGQATIMVDFVDHPCAPGTLLHVTPGRVLRLPRPSTPDGGLQVRMVLFAPAFLPRLEPARALLSPFGPVVLRLPAHQRAGITRAIDDLATEYAHAVADTDEIAIEVLRHLLSALILRIARLPQPDDLAPAANDTFMRFQHELERSFAATRNASDYATRLGYTLRTLNRACHTATGRTAKTLIEARVILEAKRLLAHTDLPVAAIGRRLGFTEPTNFGKFFHRETGHPPGTFRTRERT